MCGLARLSQAVIIPSGTAEVPPAAGSSVASSTVAGMSRMASPPPGSLSRGRLIIPQPSPSCFPAWRLVSKRECSKRTSPGKQVLIKPLLASHLLISCWSRQVTQSSPETVWAGATPGRELQQPPVLMSTTVSKEGG